MTFLIHLNIVPFHVVHVVLVDSELSPRQRHSGHLVLQRPDGEGSGDDVVQQQLQTIAHREKPRECRRHTLTPLRSLGLSLNFSSAFSGPPSCTNSVLKALSVGTNMV
jgi:hypothetical protein